MSRDVQGLVDGILIKDDLTLILVAVSTEDARGIDREDLITLNVKEKS